MESQLILIIGLIIGLLIQTIRIMFLERDKEQLKIRINILNGVNQMPKYENPPKAPEQQIILDSENDDIYLFAVKDYKTELVGRFRKNVEFPFYYVQRGDGTIYKYDVYRVIWSHELMKIDVRADKNKEFNISEPTSNACDKYERKKK